ncbi:unnamed protein product [Musa acuminata subsp. burmannicoides]
MALLTSVHPTSSSTHQQSDMAYKALIVLGLAALLLFSLETATARHPAKKTEEKSTKEESVNQQKYPGGSGGYPHGGFGGYPGGGFGGYCRWGCCRRGFFGGCRYCCPFPV